jgi:hypothetical protein
MVGLNNPTTWNPDSHFDQQSVAPAASSAGDASVSELPDAERW